MHAAQGTPRCAPRSRRDCPGPCCAIGCIESPRARPFSLAGNFDTAGGGAAGPRADKGLVPVARSGGAGFGSVKCAGENWRRIGQTGGGRSVTEGG